MPAELITGLGRRQRSKQHGRLVPRREVNQRKDHDGRPQQDRNEEQKTSGHKGHDGTHMLLPESSADPDVVEGPEPAVRVHETVHLGAETLRGKVVDDEAPGRVIHNGTLDLLRQVDPLLEGSPQGLVVERVHLRVVVETDVADTLRGPAYLAEQDAPPGGTPQAP